MAGHSKWANIKHKKAATDAKKSKLFSKIAKLISAEAKLSGGKDSPGLRTAVAKAKAANMSKDIIERAIKKASESKENMKVIQYEAYGPGGVAIIINTLTDNKNRTAQEVKHVLTKNGASLGGIGSVLWAFDQQTTEEGVVYKPKNTIELNDKDLGDLEKIVDELEDNDDVQDVYTNAE